jgi:hypothetical protein
MAASTTRIELAEPAAVVILGSKDKLIIIEDS